MPRFTVLVVDDEEFVRESLVDLLENEGYRTRFASNSVAALKIVEKETLHVIVTDLHHIFPRAYLVRLHTILKLVQTQWFRQSTGYIICLCMKISC